jgi:hypothetical protein
MRKYPFPSMVGRLPENTVKASRVTDLLQECNRLEKRLWDAQNSWG